MRYGVWGLVVGVALAWTGSDGAKADERPDSNSAKSSGTNEGKVVLPSDPHEVFCRSLYFSALRGARWLKSMQRDDGLFVYGWIPSLNRPLAGDNHLRQAGAAAALARAAAVTNDQELTLAARQAIVMLLATYTEADPDDPEKRRPTIATQDANPVGFAALLLWAISELPQPTDALVQQGERIARFIVSRQRPNGSINISPGFDVDPTDEDPAVGIHFFPGEALYALMRSYANRQEPWKLDAVKRALPYYRQQFKAHPSLVFAPWQTAAYVEAYLWTKEDDFANFVFEMNDWVLQFQYVAQPGVDAQWKGGFASLHEGHIVHTPPGASTGSYVEGLVEACRVSGLLRESARKQLELQTQAARESQRAVDRKIVDAARAAEARHLAYQQAAQRGFQFLMSNQYSLNDVPHFERWFRQKLQGAFYASVQDGTVRIDFAQHAVAAMFHYLSHVADVKDVAQFHRSPTKAN